MGARRVLIPGFVEEVLRFESPITGDFRLSRVPVARGRGVADGGHDADGAQRCRQPRRPPVRRAPRVAAGAGQRSEHLAFGHGIHFCPGAPLARAEGRITLERVLDRMAEGRIDEAQHGPPGARRYRYFPTYILRGLSRLHVEFTAS